MKKYRKEIQERGKERSVPPSPVTATLSRGVPCAHLEVDQQIPLGSDLIYYVQINPPQATTGRATTN